MHSLPALGASCIGSNEGAGLIYLSDVSVFLSRGCKAGNNQHAGCRNQSCARGSNAFSANDRPAHRLTTY
jgi:hypothetical protein